MWVLWVTYSLDAAEMYMYQLPFKYISLPASSKNVTLKPELYGELII